jgi:hypothetical protein
MQIGKHDRKAQQGSTIGWNWSCVHWGLGFAGFGSASTPTVFGVHALACLAAAGTTNGGHQTSTAEFNFLVRNPGNRAILLTPPSDGARYTLGQRRTRERKGLGEVESLR